MRKTIFSFLGMAAIFLATSVYAAGTATVKYDSITVGTLTLGSQDLAKVPLMKDNTGSFFDSGTLTITSGSQTVSTSLTTVNRVFLTVLPQATGSTTTTGYTVAGATFTAYVYNPVTGATATTDHVGSWFAIDE